MSAICYNRQIIENVENGDMSEEQLRKLWEKTDAHARAIGDISERTFLLEHQAKTHEADMKRMMDRAEESDTAIRRDIQTMNGTMVELLKTMSEHKGARNALMGFAKTALPWLLAGIGGVIWLIQVLRT